MPTNLTEDQTKEPDDDVAEEQFLLLLAKDYTFQYLTEAREQQDYSIPETSDL